MDTRLKIESSVPLSVTDVVKKIVVGKVYEMKRSMVGRALLIVLTCCVHSGDLLRIPASLFALCLERFEHTPFI